MPPSHDNRLLETLTCDITLSAAYEWLTTQEEGVTAITRRQWRTLRPQLQEQLASGEYSFTVQTRVQSENKSSDLWTDQDRIVLKALTLTLEPELKKHVSQRYAHLGDRGGAKAAVHETKEYLQSNQDSWVMQSDVAGYYAHINHHTLHGQIETLIPSEKFILRLLWQYMNRIVYVEGNYVDINMGIPLGCSLSPLMAALYFKPLDTVLEEIGGFYSRFVDDWVLIVSTHWQLRKAVKLANICLEGLGFDKHPGKTFIGRSGKGFDFLGYHLTPRQLGFCERIIQRRDEKIDLHYEEGADTDYVEQYVSRWQEWARAGVGVLAGVSGWVGTSSFALGADIDNTFSFAGLIAQQLDVDGDMANDFEMNCSANATLWLYALSPNVFLDQSFQTSSQTFGVPSLAVTSFSDTSQTTTYYLRMASSGGYYGWLTIAGDCTSLRYVGNSTSTPSLKPDGTSSPANSTPAISINNSTLPYTENDTATQIDATGTISDSDGDTDWNGGALVARITGNSETEDEISISDIDGDGTAITVSGTNIFSNGTDIGDLSTSGGMVTSNTALTITLDIDATNANVQEVLQSIRYRNTSDAPGISDRTVTFTATDTNSASANDTRTIAVTAVNDAPTFTGLPTITGSGKVGETLGLADVGTNDEEGDPVSLSYQWKVDGTNINAAMSAAYTVIASDKRKTITCTLTANDSKSDVATFTTAGVKVNANFPWSVFIPVLVSPKK